MTLVDRAKNILLTPKTEWDVINAETTTPNALFTSFVLPLALVAAAGRLLGEFLMYRGTGLMYLFTTFIMTAAMSAIGFFVSLYVIDILAPSFGSEKNLAKSGQLVAYAMVPCYFASLLAFLPTMGGLVGVLGWIYSIYLMYLGVGLLKKTPEDKKVVYLVVAGIVMIVIGMVVAGILGTMLFGAMRPIR